MIRLSLLSAVFALQCFAMPAAAQRGDCVIKGNISARGERIYHLPGDHYYSKTRIEPAKGERWFCSEAEARAAGWRRTRR